jgi:hypothetical protein
MTECSADTLSACLQQFPRRRGQECPRYTIWPCSLLKETARLDRNVGARYGGRLVFFAGRMKNDRNPVRNR